MNEGSNNLPKLWKLHACISIWLASELESYICMVAATSMALLSYRLRQLLHTMRKKNARKYWTFISLSANPKSHVGINIWTVKNEYISMRSNFHSLALPKLMRNSSQFIERSVWVNGDDDKSLIIPQFSKINSWCGLSRL